MKRLITMLVLLALLGGGYWWLQKQSALPEWYVQEDCAPAMPPVQESLQRAGKVSERLQQGTATDVAERDVDALIVSALEKKAGGSSEKYLKGLKTEITPEQLSIEMVVDAAEIPWDKLPQRARSARPLIEKFAALSGGNLVLRAAGKPQTSNGELTFGDDAIVRIGAVEYPLNSLLEMMDAKDRQQLLDVLGGLAGREVVLREGELLLESR